MLLRRGSEALRPIYQNCVFHSEERSLSHWQVAQELAEHTIAWKRGAVDAAMYKGRVRRLEAYVLRYGAEVEITPRPFEDFVLVHMSLRGAAEVESDGQRIEIAEGRAALIAPKRKIQLRWHAGTEQLILKLPHALIHEVLERLGRDNLDFAPGCLIPSALTPQWDVLMQSVLGIMRLSSDAGLSPLWLDDLERNVALFALAHHGRDSVVPSPLTPEPYHDRAGMSDEARRIDGALRFMQENMSVPLSLSDIAAAAGVSVRTLNSLSNRHLGTTPMEALRNLRLDFVRHKLRLNPQAGVTETALEAGFGNLGRFASYYLERFGELPRHTAGQRDD
ncbi:MAG: AraC family transcriptional regulator [Comamonadaceae bacterium]|nr:AraC family transcriptional regulator [Comamonadaceae bacterium]